MGAAAGGGARLRRALHRHRPRSARGLEGGAGSRGCGRGSGAVARLRDAGGAVRAAGAGPRRLISSETRCKQGMTSDRMQTNWLRVWLCIRLMGHGDRLESCNGVCTSQDGSEGAACQFRLCRVERLNFSTSSAKVLLHDTYPRRRFVNHLEQCR